MSDREMAMQRCRNCGQRFAVLSDEQSMHACPRCGYDGTTRRDPEEAE